MRMTINGASLAADVRGEGPAILFIHGYPLDRTIWEHQLAALDGFRIVGALGAMKERPDSTPLLPMLAGLPTLVVVGAEDAITSPAQAQALAAAIPGARLEVIPGAGHLPPIEQPEATTLALREFLRTLPP